MQQVVGLLYFGALQVRGVLNKLTPEKFHKLSNDILNVGLDSTTILKGVILLVSYIKNLCGLLIGLLFFCNSINLHGHRFVKPKNCVMFIKKNL